MYHQVRLSKEEGGEGEVTNPGEWPWAALIFNGNEYVGSGVLLDNDVVVTTATKVQKFLRSPSDLTIRIGDFDPTSDWTNSLEDFPHVEMEVVCIKLHPRELLMHSTLTKGHSKICSSSLQEWYNHPHPRGHSDTPQASPALLHL